MSLRVSALGKLRNAASVALRELRDPADVEPLGEPFEASYRRAKPFSMAGRERMFGLWQAIDYVCRAGIDGDFVECGVWRGGSSMLAAMAFAAHSDLRPLWMYDTYEGMTPPTEHDRLQNGETAAERLAAQDRMTGDDWAYASLDDVKAQMASVGELPSELIHYVQGPVEETIPATVPERIALLRLDTDWYESTRHELEHLWPRLSTGGVLIIDDYGHWQGAREAVDEYLEANGIVLLLNRIDYTGRIAIKS